jgi:hypothetical protein
MNACHPITGILTLLAGFGLRIARQADVSARVDCQNDFSLLRESVNFGPAYCRSRMLASRHCFRELQCRLMAGHFRSRPVRCRLSLIDPKPPSTSALRQAERLPDGIPSRRRPRGKHISKLSGWYKSLYRSHRGPLCKKDGVQKTFHQGSLLPRFPD